MQRSMGIDLGTACSSLAFTERSPQARAIPDTAEILWGNNGLLVGRVAFDRIQQATGQEPQILDVSPAHEVKRMIGQSSSLDLSSNGRCTNPVEVSTAVLVKIARDATVYPGFPVKGVVLTIPAHVVDQESVVTRTAGQNMLAPLPKLVFAYLSGSGIGVVLGQYIRRRWLAKIQQRTQVCGKLRSDPLNSSVDSEIRNACGECRDLVMLRAGDPLGTWSIPHPVCILSTA